jgi:hypothetical protein
VKRREFIMLLGGAAVRGESAAISDAGDRFMSARSPEDAPVRRLWRSPVGDG